MSIRRKGNRWEVRIRVGSGQRVERTLPPTATRADARALETQIRRAQIDLAVGRKPARTIDAALDQWLATGASSLKSYRRDLKYRFAVIREYTAGKPLDALVDVAESIKQNGQREGLTAAGINRYLSILRRIGNLAERWGWTDLPLGRRVLLLPEHSVRHVYLSPEQVNKLASHADALTADMIRFAALSGLRLAELLNLRADQVRDGVIALDAVTKSGRPRGIPLPEQAAQIAAKRVPWKIGRDQLRERFIAARKAAGLAWAQWRDLRHTYASWLVQGGAPLTSVRDLLGHSSLSVTSRYAHLAPAHLDAAVATLPTLRGVGGGKRSRGNAKKAA